MGLNSFGIQINVISWTKRRHTLINRYGVSLLNMSYSDHYKLKLDNCM